MMVKHASTIVKGPWLDSQELSLVEVQALTKNHWSNMTVVQKSISYARKLFNRRTVWPDQCDRLIGSLGSVSKQVREFYEFLDMNSLLPISVCALRYPVVKSLYNIDTLLDELILLIATFRGGSWLSSRQNIVLQQEIQGKLEKLLKGWQETRRHVQVFLDHTQALLHEEITVDDPKTNVVKFKSKEVDLERNS
jgi:hypothetical protein